MLQTTYITVKRCVLWQLFVQDVHVPQYSSFPDAMHSFATDVFYFFSFGYRVETESTHYKQRTNIKSCTTLYYISVLLVSLV